MASLVRLAAGRLVSALYQTTNLTSTPLRLLSTPCRASPHLSLQPITTSSSSPSWITRSSCLLTSFSSSSPQPVASLLQTAQKLRGVMATQGQRSYHVRVALKKRCASCYFVKRKGRMYVECKAKPRHKQMQLMSKRKTWREDYSKGFIQRAVFWNYNRDKHYYKLGDNQFARHDWLKGKIGVTV